MQAWVLDRSEYIGIWFLGKGHVSGSLCRWFGAKSDEFYILASQEYVTVPAEYAAEMTAYDTRIGEFRAHYAGF